MNLGTALSVAQTLFVALQSSELKEIISIFGYKSQLDNLQGTVSTINAVLRDAENKQELSHETQHWIEELKDAVFKADDLLDEFVTLAEQKQLMKADGSLSKKVRHFFSRSNNPLSIAFRMSQGVKDIKKKLDAIATNSQQFGFKLDSEPIRITKRRPETCSFVNEVDIIGREEDLEKIVNMLLASNEQCDVSFLSIVGMGGLGKTALTQLMYNDPRVIKAFPYRLWTCVADQDQKDLDVKEILRKILSESQEESTLDQVQIQLRKQLAHKKYLLVLDDVWTEKRDEWCDLVKYFSGGERGSWIVVTTRSQKTATIIGGAMYELQGLSEENSWRLFEKTAFASHQPRPSHDLAKIGREIVDKCARVPLAIRVAGSLLFGQDKSKWLSFKEIGLANIRESENSIVPILKLSFHHLESSLKSCFSFCALFPKDCEIEKGMLINLWMAHGFIVPFDKGQSIEDAGEEHFLILLRRCFFHDIKKDRFGEIIAFKIHDLMHDIAQSVSGKEIICAMNAISGNLDKKVSHLSIYRRREYGKYSLGKNRIRSHLCFDLFFFEVHEFSVEELVASCRCIRALDLRGLKIKSLPSSIGELLHLRYLDLSRNENLEVLPKSITKLCNLQTLILRWCSRFKELPKDLNKLVKLRALDVSECLSLTSMPRDLGKLTCLHTLSDFKVGGEDNCSSWEQLFQGLEELKPLKNLKSSLNIEIRWPSCAMDAREDGKTEGLYLKDKEHLDNIWIDFKDEEGVGEMDDEGSICLMEDLKPHSNVKQLAVKGYHGRKMPSWVSFMPNLLELHLEDCGKFEYLPYLGNLHQLKFIQFEDLANLEYIERDSPLPELTTSAEMSFFPSLEDLELTFLPNLKGWRRGVEVEHSNTPHFPQLKSLHILNCPELTSIPLCPRVEVINLKKFNRRLRITLGASASASASATASVPKLREVLIDNMTWLNSLPIESFQHLETLDLYDDKEVESLGEVEELFRSCSSTMKFLRIFNCRNLSSVVSGGLEHLTALVELEFKNCANLRLSEREGEEEEWPTRLHSLRIIKFTGLLQLVSLPNWMRRFAGLEVLLIKECRGIQAMPSWMPELTSLRHLQVWNTSASLKSRCQRDPPGEDWPYIQHIRTLAFL